MSHVHHTSHVSPHHMDHSTHHTSPHMSPHHMSPHHMAPVHHHMIPHEDTPHYITIGFVVFSILLGLIAIVLGGLAVSGNINFFKVDASGNISSDNEITAKGVIASETGFDVGQTKFTVDKDGDTTVAGTLNVTEKADFLGGIAVDKFTVDASGNTAIAGPLDVTGATTLTGALASNGDVTLGDAQADKVLINGKLVRGNITRTDVDTETATITAAQFLGGLFVHTTTGATGTVTMDTAANLISTLKLENDGEIATCYYVNDGDQTATINGSSTGVTLITNNNDVITQTSTIIVVLRTGSAAVSVFTV